MRNYCETLAKARTLAPTRGLDPSQVVCSGCVDGTDCTLSANQQQESPQDYAQNIRLKAAEGQANVNRFYKKIEKHFKLTAGRSSGTH